MVENDDLSVSATGTFADKNVGNEKTVTISGLTLTGDDKDNYVLATTDQQEETKASITKREITVSGIISEGKTYDGNTDATVDTSKATFDGIVGDDQLTVSTTGSFSDKNVGEDKIVLFSTLILGGASESNYKLADTGNQADTTADITPKEVELEWSDTEFTYDGETHIPTTTVTNLVDTDECEVTVEGEQTNAGTYTATAKELSNTNYKLPNNKTTEFNIAPKEIKVSGITAQDKTYDGTTEATLNYENVVLDGKVGEDDITIKAVGTFEDKNAGTQKTVIISNLELDGTAKDNYVLASTDQQESTIANINKKEIIVSNVTAQDKEYDGNTEATLNYENVMLDGKVGEEDVTIKATGTFEDKNVGKDKIVYIKDLELAGEDKDNYVLASTSQQESTTATITSKEVELKWSDTELIYNGQAQKPSATITNLVNEDTCEVSVDGEQTNAGTYTAKASDLSNPNYKLPNEVTTEFTIAPKELSYDMLIMDSNDFLDNGEVQGPSIIMKDNEVVISENDYEISGDTKSKESGTHFITVDGKGNYTGTLSTSWMIYSNKDSYQKEKGKDGKGDIEVYVDVIDNTESISVSDLNIEFAKGLLSKEDIERNNNGESVLIYMEIIELNKDDVDDNDRNQIMLEFNRLDVDNMRWFNIIVWKKIGNDAATMIHDTIKEIKMDIEVPDEYKEAPVDYERTYYLARCHDGEAIILTDTDSTMIEAASSKFSIYAIGYKDVEIKKDDKKDDQKDDSKKEEQKDDSKQDDKKDDSKNGEERKDNRSHYVPKTSAK